MYKVGIVKNIDPSKAKVRVQFPDLDNMLSYWLPVVFPFVSDDEAYYMPVINAQVVCLMDMNMETGCVIGQHYTDVEAPEINNENKFRIKFKDGTVIEYDKQTHNLMANVNGGAVIAAVTDISLGAPVVNIAAPVINMTGNIAHTGNQITSGTITAEDNISDGISGKSHVHGGVYPGGANTGVPQ